MEELRELDAIDPNDNTEETNREDGIDWDTDELDTEEQLDQPGDVEDEDDEDVEDEDDEDVEDEDEDEDDEDVEDTGEYDEDEDIEKNTPQDTSRRVLSFNDFFKKD